MKKILLLIPILAVMLFGCAGSGTNGVALKADVAQFEKYIKELEGKDAKVKVEKLADIEEMPGFAYVKVTVERNGTTKSNNAVTNGRILVDAQIFDLKEKASLTSLLNFKFAEPKKIDVSNLTLAGGKKDGKTVIVEITDFQCPYCKEANKLFKEKLADKSDYALYIVHMPLEMHPNARIMAQIFEAGMKMGVNLKNDLFEFNAEGLLQAEAENYSKTTGIKEFKQEDVDKIFRAVDAKIIDIFADKTSDAAKFKELVKSQEIVDKVEKSILLATSLGERSTPAFYINGKSIQGFDAPLLNKMLGDIK